MSKVCMDTRVVTCEESIVMWLGAVSLSSLGHVRLVACGFSVWMVWVNEHARVPHCKNLGAKLLSHVEM